MSRKLRIFISSTMTDLANERAAVSRCLSSFNFEVVNAESWGPNGESSWEKIKSEIESSDIFILIVGERYGWIPSVGAMADKDLSVTELEYQEAKRVDIPILPFLKNLGYEAERDTDDAKLRDKFRENVGDWAMGKFLTKFDLAEDLKEKVGKAVIELLSDSYQRSRISFHAPVATKIKQDLEIGAELSSNILMLPDELISAVRSDNIVLFAGSGISLAAGLPSANAFAELIRSAIVQKEPKYNISAAGAVIAGLAADYEALSGRYQFVDILRDLMEPPQGVFPTLAHRSAVRLFPIIFTTNYDNLFERAMRDEKLESKVIWDDNDIPSQALIKLHGTFERPESLIISEKDIAMYDRSRPQIWRATVDILKQKKVIIIGSSLRDPSILRLFNEVGDSMSGYFIAPDITISTQPRLRQFGLECIRADANSFFLALEKALKIKTS